MNQVFDLVAISLTKAMGADIPRTSSAHSTALMKLRAVIEARLSDPTLDAGTVAAAAGISVRYANTVLAREGTSIMRVIQARRLARCRQALEDPMQAHRIWVGIFRHDSFRPQVQGGLWCPAQRVPAPREGVQAISSPVDF